jgi:hypothetical protein
MVIGILKDVGKVILVILLIAGMVIPDPIGKIVEIWRFFRGDRLD